MRTRPGSSGSVVVLPAAMHPSSIPLRNFLRARWSLTFDGYVHRKVVQVLRQVPVWHLWLLGPVPAQAPEVGLRTVWPQRRG